MSDFFLFPQKSTILESALAGGTLSTLAHLTKRELESAPTARVLVLTPRRAIQDRLQQQLSELGVEAQVVDRFRYRELEDSAPGNEAVWRSNTAFVLSMDFAKQGDIARSLIQVPWTLLIVDQAQQLTRSRQRVVRKIMERSAAVRILFVVPDGAEPIQFWGGKPFAKTSWRFSQEPRELTFADGRSSVPIELIRYHEDESELRIRQTLDQLPSLFGTTEAESLARSILHRTVSSSPAALEFAVRRLRNQLAHGDSNAKDIDQRTTLLVALDEFLDQIESLPTDSKFEILNRKLKEVNPGDLTRVIILTDYRATLFYLQGHLEENSWRIHVVHSALSEAEKAHNLDSFSQEGGILLATIAAIQTVESRVADCVLLYDLPGNTYSTRVISRHLQALGRPKPPKFSLFFGVAPVHFVSEYDRMLSAQFAAMLEKTPA